jgi:CO/xanthine dehydrogenase Mo-binding subunit
MQPSTFNSVGLRANRIDGIEKVTGQAKFTGDIALPELLEAKVLRSAYPHALIKSIDTRKAEALAGVIAVLTFEDVKDINP